MLNILARMIFQLIPVACPHHFATGDVYELLSILRSAPRDGPLTLTVQPRFGRLLYPPGLPPAPYERL